MLRHIILIVLLLLFSVSQVHTQQKWISFIKQSKTGPTINVKTSNNANVSFSVQIDGISVSEKNIGKIKYQTLTIPEAEHMNITGAPQMPVITKLIAIPDCDDVQFSSTQTNNIEYNGYYVAPTPTHEIKKSFKNSNDRDIIYKEDYNIYSKDAFFPGKDAEILEIGYVRGQKVARVAIYPIQFNPISKKIKVNTNFDISLSFNNASSPVNKELGIFRNMMHHVALNYELNGISASMKGKDLIKKKQLGKTPLGNNSIENINSGSVTFVTDLNNLSNGTIPADYIIITHSSLLAGNNWLETLADHRKDYNGYDVAIVKVDGGNSNDNIYNVKNQYGQIKYPHPQDQEYVSIRDFIKDVYLNGHANNTADDKLGYILLVGDANFDNSTLMVPASNCYNAKTYLDPPENTIYIEFELASDYYYSCVTQNSNGEFDANQDVMYGRLSVGNVTELGNAVQKIIDYESPSSIGNWRNNVAFMSFSPDLFDGENCGANYAFTQMAQIVPQSNYLS